MKFLLHAFLAGLPYAILMSFFFLIRFGWPIGIFVALLSGVLFGIAIASYIHMREKRLDPEATFETLANHYSRGEYRGGRLSINEQYLLFTPHKHNIQKHGVELPLSAIERVIAVRTLWLVPNGIEVHASGGRVERFVVPRRRAWIERLTQRPIQQ